MTKKEERNNELYEIALNIFKEYLGELYVGENGIIDITSMNTTQDIQQKIEESFIDRLKNEKGFFNHITGNRFFKNNKYTRKKVCDNFMFNYGPIVQDEGINQ